MQLSPQQEEILHRVHDFIENKNQSVFILKGYAGTGKTTLIKSLVPRIAAQGKKIFVMAPTGRAAKVLKEKTGGEATTIHRAIYEYQTQQALQHDEEGKLIEEPPRVPKEEEKPVRSKGVDDLQYWFAIRRDFVNNDASNLVIIVDEASMVGAVPTYQEMLHFGTDVLLEDLLTFANLHKGAKVIFVGDPAQLPPVGDAYSAALDEKYFEAKGIGVTSVELTEVLRQGGESAILKNAMMVRDLLQAEHRNELCFERRVEEVEEMTSEEVVETFYQQYPTPQIGDAVIIAYSNALVKDYNEAIRKRYFPDSPNVVAGDILQVVRNNINLMTGVEFYNGDFLKVLDAEPTTENVVTKVWVDEGGERKQIPIEIRFRNITIFDELRGSIKCKIIDNLLHSTHRNLTLQEHLALYIDFKMRHPRLKEKEAAFKDALLNDPYLNALQTKFGYAITGHKSQGGEWKTVFVDYTLRTGFSDDALRWTYTATTRATEKLYGVKLPNLRPMTGWRFAAITRLAQPAKEAFALAAVGEVEALPTTAQDFQKQKCRAILAQLKKAGYRLQNIQTLQYCDRYTIITPAGNVVADAFYNGKGIYTRYQSKSPLPEREQILAMMQEEGEMQFDLQYAPSSPAFEQLWAQMERECGTLGITITNVVEHLAQYYVAYYLKTSGKFAQILFYFKNGQVFTQAISASDLGENDEKLRQLIDHLQPQP